MSAIDPVTVISRPEASGVSCRFGDDFQIQSSAEVHVFTAPGPQGWQKTINPAAALGAVPAGCAGQTAVPATLRGQPSDAAYAQAIEASEMEHVHALELLHEKHFVPYYHFIRGLESKGKDVGACTTDLRQQIGKRAEQAALGFIAGDQAETRRLDDPALGTHHGRIAVTVDPGCKAITLMAGAPTNPQQPGLGPGNVAVVPPVSRPVDPATLMTSGSDLKDATSTIRTFSNPANARLALQAFHHYGITEVLSIGTFEILLANGSAPSGPFKGIVDRRIDPAYYQVTVDIPAAGHWSIVEVVGDQMNLIHDFNANRDEAYSAVALMQRHRFNREAWLGFQGNADLRFFRTD